MSEHETVLVLRCCEETGESSHGFSYPLKLGSPVEAPDWDPDENRACGGGLHGLPWGEGDAGLLCGDLAQVYEVNVADGWVPSAGKVRWRRGRLVYQSTDRSEAAAYIAGNGGAGRSVVHLTATAGDGGTATAGYGGTATAGYGGTATAGDGGTATAGYGGTATAGDGGTATAGYEGTATAGDRGELRVRWWDGKRYRLAVGYVGEDGIMARAAYCVEGGNFVAVPVVSAAAPAAGEVEHG